MVATSEVAESGSFRVEELAARTGVPVRTTREYQAWRVLHPPEKRGRVGWYDESHLERLHAIARLQQRGYSIAGIRDLLEAWETGSELRDVLGGVDPRPEGLDETPAVVTELTLRRLLPEGSDVGTVAESLIDAGVLARGGSDLVASSPALLVLVGDTLRAGLSEDEALRLARAIVDATASASDAIAAAVSAVVSRGDLGDIEPVLRRGRLLVGRALASHLVDQVGR